MLFSTAQLQCPFYRTAGECLQGHQGHQGRVTSVLPPREELRWWPWCQLLQLYTEYIPRVQTLLVVVIPKGKCVNGYLKYCQVSKYILGMLAKMGGKCFFSLISDPLLSFWECLRCLTLSDLYFLQNSKIIDSNQSSSKINSRAVYARTSQMKLLLPLQSAWGADRHSLGETGLPVFPVTSHPKKLLWCDTENLK